MNVASRELSKELYELSGWDDPYFHFRNAPWSKGELIALKEHAPTYIPAYDLGYLLRKLPPHSLSKRPDGVYWVTRRLGAKKGIIKVNGPTPESAVCVFAIELFKQGVLSGKD